MKNTLFIGCATAMITPYTEKGIDYDAMARLIDRQIQSGVFENRLKLQELNEYGAEVPGRFEIRNAQTAQRELEQAQQVKTSGAPTL